MRETTGGNTGTAPASLPHHLLTSRTARFCELGAGYYTSRIDKARKIRGHIRQLEALGYTVTLAPAG